MDVILVSPNLDPSIALGGVSAVSRFIIENNKTYTYIHFELGKKDSERGGFARIFQLRNRLKAWKSLLKSNPDAIIHYNFPLSPGAIIRDFIFMREVIKKKQKMIVHIHGGLYMNSSHIPFVFNKILKHIFHWNIPFIVLSEHEKNILSSKYAVSNIYVLPNCVELGDNNERISKPDIFTMGYIGRITEAKGMKELLEACKILLSRGIVFKLKIAGIENKNESFIEAFEKNLNRSFEYLGIISGKTKKDFLNSIDVFVLPSYFEGLPISLLESMSFGAVPVVTPVGSIPEVVDNGVNGLLIKDHDTNSLVNALLQLYEKESLRIELSKAAKITIEKHFSPTVYFENLNKIYQTV